MRIGLLSDSHGRAETVERAAKLLASLRAGPVIHLGDIGGPQVLDALLRGLGRVGRARPRVHIVLGNADLDADGRDSAGLGRAARRRGIEVHEPLGRLQFGRKTLVFLHGHVRKVLAEALAAGPDFLLHGHTHRLRDERVGKTRVINPGALFRAARYTAAVLDLPSGRLRWLAVSSPPSPQRGLTSRR